MGYSKGIMLGLLLTCSINYTNAQSSDFYSSLNGLLSHAKGAYYKDFGGIGLFKIEEQNVSSKMVNFRTSTTRVGFDFSVSYEYKKVDWKVVESIDIYDYSSEETKKPIFRCFMIFASDFKRTDLKDNYKMDWDRFDLFMLESELEAFRKLIKQIAPSVTITRYAGINNMSPVIKW